MKMIGKPLTRAVLFAAILAALCSLPMTALAAGWEKRENGSWSYRQEDGSLLVSGLTPDGYYIDSSGVWWETREIMGISIPNRNSFLASSQAGSLTSFEPELTKAMNVIVKECGSIRSITLDESSITYWSEGTDGERELMCLYKDLETDGYRLRISCALTPRKGSQARASWYDYQVMQLLLTKISRAGVQLSEAIYSSWELDNSYGLKSGQWVAAGDASINYEAISGAGIYYIAVR